VEFLVRNGACVYTATNTNYKTALHFACGANNLKMCTALINLGAPNVFLDSDSKTPIQLASASYQAPILEELRKYDCWTRRRPMMILVNAMSENGFVPPAASASVEKPSKKRRRSERLERLSAVSVTEPLSPTKTAAAGVYKVFQNRELTRSLASFL
jgi:ankyrin repeat protein